MSTAPTVPPRPYESYNVPLNNPPPLPPLPRDIRDRYNTENGSLPHFEKPLIAPTPHHAANVSNNFTPGPTTDLFRWHKHSTISCQHTLLGRLLRLPTCDPWQILIFNLLPLLLLLLFLRLLLSLRPLLFLRPLQPRFLP